MKRKQANKQKYLLVLLLTILIFSTGILVGHYTSGQKLDEVKVLSEQLQLQSLGVELEYQILRENICEHENILFLTEDLFEISEKLTYMENALGEDNSRVKELKEFYFVLEAKHWLLAKDRVETCLEGVIDMNETIILYFYSNEGDCPRCKQQGIVLTYLQQEYEGMKIYSFDTNSNSPVVRVIKNVYGLSNNTPALIINDEAIEEYLDADGVIGFVRKQQEQIQNQTAN